MPREHGTWAWLLVPSFVGLFALRAPSTPAVLVFIAALAAFLARSALDITPREATRRSAFAWALVFSAGATASGLIVVFGWERWFLLPLAAVVAAGPLAVRSSRALQFRRRVLGEAVVVVSLAWLATAIAYASSGSLDARATFLWLPVALYLLGSMACVRLALAPTSERGASVRAERWRLAARYHASLPPVLLAAAASGVLPWLALLAFIPMIGKALGLLVTRVRATSVTRLGLSEAGHAALFTALLVLSYRFGV